MSTANFSHEPDDSFNLQRYIQCDLGYICDDEDDYGACECVCGFRRPSFIKIKFVMSQRVDYFRQVDVCVCLLSSAAHLSMNSSCSSLIVRTKMRRLTTTRAYNSSSEDEKNIAAFGRQRFQSFIWAMPMVGQVVNFSANNIIFTIMYMVCGRSGEVNKIHLLLDLRADG